MSGTVTTIAAIAITGAVGLWLGLAITTVTTLRPGLQPLARRHPIAQAAYAVALAEVAVGIGLPVLLRLGLEPAMAAWARLKPAPRLAQPVRLRVADDVRDAGGLRARSAHLRCSI